MTNREAIEHIKTASKIAIDAGYDSDIVDACAMAVRALEQAPKTDYKSFAEWVASEIFSEDWEYNKDSFAEIACRKLAELGIVTETNDKWVFTHEEKIKQEQKTDTKTDTWSIDEVADALVRHGILKRVPIQEPCEDCISRKAVHEILNDAYFLKLEDGAALQESVHQLPSVTPQEKTGHWIEVVDEVDRFGNKTWHHECSVCGCNKSGWGEYKYCPNCGARLKSELSE